MAQLWIWRRCLAIPFAAGGMDLSNAEHVLECAWGDCDKDGVPQTQPTPLWREGVDVAQAAAPARDDEMRRRAVSQAASKALAAAALAFDLVPSEVPRPSAESSPFPTEPNSSGCANRQAEGPCAKRPRWASAAPAPTLPCRPLPPLSAPAQAAAGLPQALSVGAHAVCVGGASRPLSSAPHGPAPFVDLVDDDSDEEEWLAAARAFEKRVAALPLGAAFRQPAPPGATSFVASGATPMDPPQWAVSALRSCDVSNTVMAFLSLQATAALGSLPPGVATALLRAAPLMPVFWYNLDAAMMQAAQSAHRALVASGACQCPLAVPLGPTASGLAR